VSSDLTSEGGHGAVPTGPEVPVEPKASAAKRDWPLYEVFVRGKRGLNHVHVGSLHAPDDEMAVHEARDLYTRRNEGVSIWVVRAQHITASSPDEKDPMFAPSGDKVYRHPTFYDIPENVPHI
jgi:ring-1,2-phenylacetyl-CoA epoxidase subunit PaaB